MSANRYNHDGSAIIAADGKEYAVETAHELPLPEGIQLAYDDNSLVSVAAAGGDKNWSACLTDECTHWLARRPLPPVPKVKTQEELDEEWVSDQIAAYRTDTRTIIDMLRAAIAYARKCPAKQEGES